jgi:hypothetical protein
VARRLAIPFGERRQTFRGLGHGGHIQRLDARRSLQVEEDLDPYPAALSFHPPLEMRRAVALDGRLVAVLGDELREDRIDTV